MDAQVWTITTGNSRTYLVQVDTTETDEWKWFITEVTSGTLDAWDPGSTDVFEADYEAIADAVQTICYAENHAEDEF